MEIFNLKLQGICKPRVFSGWRPALRFATDIIIVVLESLIISIVYIKLEQNLLKINSIPSLLCLELVEPLKSYFPGR